MLDYDEDEIGELEEADPDGCGKDDLGAFDDVFDEFLAESAPRALLAVPPNSPKPPTPRAFRGFESLRPAHHTPATPLLFSKILTSKPALRSSLAACSPATPAPMIPIFLTCAGGPNA